MTQRLRRDRVRVCVAVEPRDRRSGAVSKPKRMPQIPDTMAVEEILPGFSMDNWKGFLAPAGTPRPILEAMARRALAENY